MVERELEITVGVEKEREVTETYIDEETITETVTYCDACGEACDERGGRKRVAIFDDETDADYGYTVAPDIDRALKAEIEMAIRDRFTEVDDQTDFSALTWDSPVTTSLELRRYKKDHYTAESAYIEAEKAVTNTINQFDFSKYVIDHTPDEMAAHDLCGECATSLGVTSETLDTAAYETVDHDDEEGGLDPFFLFAVGIDLIADAVTDIVTSRPRLTAFTISVCWLLIFSALALEVHIVFLVLQWLALPLGVWIEGAARHGW